MSYKYTLPNPNKVLHVLVHTKILRHNNNNIKNFNCF